MPAFPALKRRAIIEMSLRDNRTWRPTFPPSKQPNSSAITKGGRRIGLECDGKNFHNLQSDRLRDEAILQTRFIDAIYRVPGRSLWFFTYDVLDLLQGVEPTLFSERGRQILGTHLIDGLKREDSWDHDSALRAFRKRKADEDDETEEGSNDDYKSPNYVLLEWRLRERAHVSVPTV